MDETRTGRFLGYTVALVAGFVLGLVGPTIARGLQPAFPPGLVTNGFAQFVSALVIGVLAGALGRGFPGIVGLWLGLWLAEASGRFLSPPGLLGFPPLVTALVVASIGYAAARAADPLGEAFRRRRTA